MSRYPIYVISKSRWDRPLTALALQQMNVPFHIVIEPQEYKHYIKVFPMENIHVLPFSNIGQGSIPARNWCWEHSMSIGAKQHWIMDDNIDGFLRMNNNRKVFVDDGTIFKCAEDFVDRFENVGISGLQYRAFCEANVRQPAFMMNKRVYSCLLIRNDIPFRWRGRYNEDTDLSLRVLKSGMCTILFKAFLQGKLTTMRLQGGNTNELYSDNGREQMTDSLIEQHPDVASKTWKFDRWHHSVDYSPFQDNTLILKEDLNIPKKVNDYGMKLVDIESRPAFIHKETIDRLGPENHLFDK
jgi:hypothetical protein